MNNKEAAALLQARLDELEALAPRVDDAFTSWYERTISTVDHALPKDHRAHNRLTGASWSPWVYPSDPGDDRRSFESGRSTARGVLQAAIYELTELSTDDGAEGSVVLAVHEVKLLERLLTEYRKAEDEGELDNVDPEVRAEIAAEMSTIDAQLRSPKPKRSIVGAALQSLRVMTEQALGSAAGVGIVVGIKMAVDAILH